MRFEKYFDSIAEEYDEFRNSPLMKLFLKSGKKKALQKLMPKNKEVLDLGSGSGIYAEVLREKRNRVPCVNNRFYNVKEI